VHDDFAFEPIRGLPGHLPPGETLLWQGAPDWKALAGRLFHIRVVALYGLAMVAWRFGAVLQDSGTLIDALIGAALLVPVMALAVGLLAAIAWGMARTTVYSITSRRVVLRIGIALTVSINLPYKRIESADLTAAPDGTGNISLRLRPEDRVSYAVLWPHARPWKLGRAEPMLRCIPDVETVGTLLVDAMTAARDTDAVRVTKVATAEAASRPAAARHPIPADLEFAPGD